MESLDVTENDYNVSEDGNLARLISDGRLTHLFLRILISPGKIVYYLQFFNLSPGFLSKGQMCEEEIPPKSSDKSNFAKKSKFCQKICYKSVQRIGKMLSVGKKTC